MSVQEISATTKVPAVCPTPRCEIPYASGRVIHVLREMNCGGAETVIMNAYRALYSRGTQFDFAVVNREPAYYDTEIGKLGGRIFRLPDPRVFGPISYYSALKRTIRSEGPFLAVHAHAHYFSGIILRAAARAAVPIRIAHSHTSRDHSHSLSRRGYRWLMMRMVREYATHLLGASQEACNDLFGAEATARGLPQGVHNAVEPDGFSPLPQDKFLLRRELGLHGNGVLVGHVGRFEEVKNHDFLIRSFVALSHRLSDVRLVLAGDGPLRTRVMQQASATGLQGRIDFLGIVPHIPRLLAALDLFLFPSRWEGLGLALVEAQAAGIPCLVSDRVPREADIGLGLTVFRSLEDGPAAWAEASAELIGASRPEWPDRFKALRAGGYDIDSLAKAFSLIYSGVATAVRI